MKFLKRNPQKRQTNLPALPHETEFTHTLFRASLPCVSMFLESTISVGLFWLELASGNLASLSGVGGPAGAGDGLLFLLLKTALQKAMGCSL